MGKKKKKNLIQKFITFLAIVIIIVLIFWIALFIFNYIIGEQTEVTNADGSKSQFTLKKKNVINALVCGTNQNLTDTILYIKYDVKTGKMLMVSIPRDTYVQNEYCIGNKINAIYRGKNIIPLVEEVQELLDVKLDYYLFFDSDIVHQLVDAVGGVKINVPIRMKYTDPTQNLYIDLQKGEQVLNGKQAEMFVRFRHNNDMSVGYAMGDIDRTKVQQDFIKAFISTVLKPQNIIKYPELIKIALNNTDTNIITREALKYSTDITRFSTDNIESFTAEGSAKYINGISYFLLDKEATQQKINDTI